MTDVPPSRTPESPLDEPDPASSLPAPAGPVAASSEPAESLRPSKLDPYVTLRNPHYRRYAVSWFLMVFAKMVETVAVLVYVHERTADALALGTVGLVQAIPVIALAIPAGQIADRFDRRRVVLWMLSMGTVISGGMMWASQQQLPIGWFYALLGIGAVTQALGSPSRAAILPQIVEREDFPNAVAWNSSVFQIASMVGPACGGLIVGIASNPAWAFALVACCRVGSLAAMAGVRARPQERSTEPVSVETLMAGLRFVWSNKLILATITMDLFAVMLGGATYLLPVFAKDILDIQGLAALADTVASWVGLTNHASPEAVCVGLLRSAEAVGAVTMAVALAHLPPMQRAGRTMLMSVAGFGAATVVFGLSHSLWTAALMMFVIGAFDNVSVVVRHTLVQMLTPDSMRGRVSAVNGIFIVASNDLGGFESGLTARLFGPVASVVGGGIGAMCVAAAAAWRWPQILSIGSLRNIRPLDAAEAREQADDECASHA